MSLNSTKQLAEKIHMFCNLLYHIDDYIKNKKERKDQLRVSKNIRLVLREVISSKININYFINKEEFDSLKIKKGIEAVIKIDKKYIKTINPLGFNQKNLNCINLFYNSNNEKYVINYLVIEKMFSIIQFCFSQIIREKNFKLKEKFEKQNKNFVLFNTEENENYESYNNKNEENNTHIHNFQRDLLNTIVKNKNKLNEINLNKYKKENNNIYVNIFSLLNNSYKINNIPSILNYKQKINKKSNNNLRMQIRQINNQMNDSLIRAKSKIGSPFAKKNFKRNISLPMINEKKYGNNKSNSCSSKENYKINENNYLLNKKVIQIKNKNNNLYNYNRILPLYNKAKFNYYNK